MLFLVFETIFLDFCRYCCEWKQLFWASGKRVFIKSFIMTSGYSFWVNFKSCTFVQNFFLCWKALLKLGVNQFSLIFSVPNSGSSFSGQWKRIFYRMLFIPTSSNGFFFQFSLIQSNFYAIGKHYSNYGEALSQRVASLLLLETTFYAFFIYITLPMKAVFLLIENVIFFNNFFIRADGIRIQWKQYSFIYSFSIFLWKPLLALKSVSTSGNEGKKTITGRSL